MLTLLLSKRGALALTNQKRHKPTTKVTALECVLLLQQHVARGMRVKILSENAKNPQQLLQLTDSLLLLRVSMLLTL
jgi:succinate dehydrogenase hydrophobic anchor subunit